MHSHVIPMRSCDMSAESQQEYKLQIARTLLKFISSCLSVMLFHVIKTFRGKSVIGYLQQIKTATVMETWQNKRFNGQNNSSARAF